MPSVNNRLGYRFFPVSKAQANTVVQFSDGKSYVVMPEGNMVRLPEGAVRDAVQERSDIQGVESERLQEASPGGDMLGLPEASGSGEEEVRKAPEMAGRHSGKEEPREEAVLS